MTNSELLALRKENEPNYFELCEELSLLMPKTQPMDSNYEIDFELIERVLRKERKRQLEKQWNGQAGLRAKRLSSSLNGKKAKVA